MWRFATLFVFMAFCHSTAMSDCKLDKYYGDILSSYIEDCPPLLYPSKRYCCPDIGASKTYCCDEEEFYKQTIFGFLIPSVAITMVILMLIIFCVSCLCCSCCPFYRRRHRGTVYGQVHTPPAVVQVIQPQVNPTPAPMYPIQQPHPMYPPTYPSQPTGMPMPGSVTVDPPPSYTSEAYVKQPAYNPNYPQ